MPLTNSQYNALMRVYEEKRAKSRDLANLHYERACQKVPELASIDASISSASLDQAKKLLAGDDTALASLKEDIRSLSDRRRRLLSDAGFPEDYLEQHFECPDCQDTGYIGSRKCTCFKKAEIELLYAQSNLNEILEKENFDSFSFDYYSATIKNEATGLSALETARRAYDTAQRFVQNFDHKFENLFLYGDTGVGKTFLSHCIARELLRSTHCVLYFSAYDLFDMMAANSFSRKDTGTDEELIYDCDLLIIDDLGSEYTNAFIAAQFFTCINERLIHKKSTIISTNLSLESLANLYTERSFSRITSSYALLKIIGDDIRIKKKLKNREVH